MNVAAPAPGTNGSASAGSTSLVSGAEAIADLGHEVYQIDTFMAGYDRISAGYLIRADRPCLVETGTAASAPLVRDALASAAAAAWKATTHRATQRTTSALSTRSLATCT